MGKSAWEYALEIISIATDIDELNTKLSKTDKYDGVDSTSTELWATANAVRKVNEKTDNNSTSIRELNSNLATKTVENMTLNKRLRLYWDEENNLIQVYVDSTYKGNLKFTP